MGDKTPRKKGFAKLDAFKLTDETDDILADLPVLPKRQESVEASEAELGEVGAAIAKGAANTPAAEDVPPASPAPTPLQPAGPFWVRMNYVNGARELLLCCGVETTNESRWNNDKKLVDGYGIIFHSVSEKTRINLGVASTSSEWGSRQKYDDLYEYLSARLSGTLPGPQPAVFDISEWLANWKPKEESK